MSIDLESMVGVGRGPISQIGCVVSDIDEAERMYSEAFGVPAWTRIPDVVFRPDRNTYRGEPADFVIHVSLGYAGPQQIELIQPVSGVNIYTEFLERSGSGVHHLAWVPTDFDAALAAALSTGLEVVQEGATDDMEFAYLETTGMGTHFVELMRLSPRMSGFFDSMEAAAAAATGNR